MRVAIKWVLVAGLLGVFGHATPGSALLLEYTAVLSPEAIGATGSGLALVTFDTGAQTMRIQANFTGLSGPSTAAHIHCCTASPGQGIVGVATMTPSFPNWPSATSGTYDQTFDMSDSASPPPFSSTFLTANGGVAGARAALLAGVDAGEAYFNVHSSTFPGGEIRGFLTPIPEPGTAVLLLVGLGVLGWAARSQEVVHSSNTARSQGLFRGIRPGRRAGALEDQRRFEANR